MLCAYGGGHKEKTYSHEENVEDMCGASVERDIIDSIVATDWMRRYVDFIVHNVDTIEYERFGLAYINDDDIPELMLSSKTVPSYCLLLWQNEGSVYGTLKSYISHYIPRTGIFQSGICFGGTVESEIDSLSDTIVVERYSVEYFCDDWSKVYDSIGLVECNKDTLWYYNISVEVAEKIMDSLVAMHYDGAKSKKCNYSYDIMSIMPNNNTVKQPKK